MAEQTKTTEFPQEQKAIVQWKGEQITISFHDVKTLICPLATNQEAAVFLKTCHSLQLNPFASECYLIKYDVKDKAAFVVAIDSYLKAAEVNENYDGCEAGIILKDTIGKLEFREGSFLLKEEVLHLVGGWAKVYRKDRSRPTYTAVNKTECIKLTREGKPTQFWSEPKQPWMLRKTALKRALVEAFPSLFAGTLATTEVGGDIQDVEYREVPEGILPPAMEKNGKPDWRKFWVRVKSELKLTQVQARKLLKVKSIKKDLIDQGAPMEQIWNSLVHALRETHMATNVVGGQTEEVITPEKQIISDTEPGAILEEEIFGSEEEPKIPQVDDELLKGWEIVKGTVKELNITDKQIRNWFAHYNIEIGLADFARALPPTTITNEMLSKFQTMLDIYREKQAQKASES